VRHLSLLPHLSTKLAIAEFGSRDVGKGTAAAYRKFSRPLRHEDYPPMGIV